MEADDVVETASEHMADRISNQSWAALPDRKDKFNDRSRVKVNGKIWTTKATI